MNKINFKNGASGGTPLSAENLNQMQTNAENAINEAKEQATTENEELLELLTAENELLRNQIPTGTATGQSITLNDSSNLPFKSLVPKGKTIQEGTPTPETPIEIENVEGNAEVKVTGKNILINTWEIILDAQYTKSFGEFNVLVPNVTTTYIYGASNNYIGQILPAGTYAFSFNGLNFTNVYMQYLDSNGNLQNWNNGTSITITDDITLVAIRCDSVALPTGTYNWEAQIEEGSTVTEYEQHKEQTAYFPLAEGQKLMEGSYLADDGVHNSKIQVVFDGSEAWATTTEDGNLIFYLNYVLNAIRTNKELCNRFVLGNSTSTNSNCFWITGDGEGIRFRKENITTAVDFKTWLSNNNVTVEYELSEEEIVPYTEEQQEAWNNIKKLTSYKNTTNITSSCETEVIYYKDLETLFNNISA